MLTVGSCNPQVGVNVMNPSNRTARRWASLVFSPTYMNDLCATASVAFMPSTVAEMMLL